VTGFGKGLYRDDELDANFYAGKDQKTLFLKKILDLTNGALKTEVDVKPSKILAGAEPERTNAFLQAIHKAATSGTDYSSLVKKIVTKYNEELQTLIGGGAAAPPAEEKKEDPPPKPKEEPKKAPEKPAPASIIGVPGFE
jgi:TRAF3-interacting protein 1